MIERPISPHLTVYKWAYTMALSILHRVTGTALALALIGFVAWLISASLGKQAYGAAQPTLTGVPFKVLLALAVLALLFHLCNGLRHLAWDLGWGFERVHARRSAVLVVAMAAIAGSICLYLIFRHSAGGP